MLADLPGDMTADRFPKDVLAPTARFLRDVQGVTGFAWDTANVATQSVSPGERNTVSAYLSEQAARHTNGDTIPAYEAGETTPVGDTAPGDALPAWLTPAMEGG